MVMNKDGEGPWEREEPFPEGHKIPRKLYYSEKIVGSADAGGDNHLGVEEIGPVTRPEFIVASVLAGKIPNLISSEIVPSGEQLPLELVDCHGVLDLDWHAPVLDLDYNVRLVKSSTEGHYHLYYDKIIPWSKYKKLLVAMHECGMLNPGYYKSAMKNKFTLVRWNTTKQQEGLL